MPASLALESFIDETIRRAQRSGYNPTTFIGMRGRHGTVDAIEKLVVSGDLQSGFKRLHQLGLIDWTIEAAVLKYPAAFLKGARDSAAFRIRTAENGDL